MKFYLCGPTSMAEEIESYHMALKRRNHVVTSRWHTWELGSPRLELNDPMIVQRAVDDLRDIDECDILIIFTGKAGRGGRHYETGYAYGVGKIVWLIGEMEHAFHSLHYQSMTQFETWAECLMHIEVSLPS